jgi:hypothetical protein
MSNPVMVFIFLLVVNFFYAVVSVTLKGPGWAWVIIVITNVVLIADIIYSLIRLRQTKRQLAEFLKSQGFVKEAKIQNSTELDFISGLNEDDQYFVFIENYQPLSIRESDTAKTKLNSRYTVYVWNEFCIVKDFYDGLLVLYRR